MYRRTLLATLGTTAFAGCAELQRIGGTPTLDTEIRRINPQGFVTEIIFYQSGAAEFTFQADTACYDRIGFTHEIKNFRTEKYGSWELPEFAGTIVADIAGSLPESNFPSRDFRFKLYKSGQGTCIGLNGVISQWQITLPDVYFSE